MLNTAHQMIEEADAVLTYNGKRFDIPTLYREFVTNNLLPPAPIKHIDLLQTVRKQFKFVSNKLDFVCQSLDLGKKVTHEGYDMWLKCGEGDEKAWKKMKKYNIGDISILENLYHKVKPWIINHPNRALYSEIDVQSCRVCGHHHFHRRGYSTTNAGRYARVQCQGCGAWSRFPTNETTTQDRKILLRDAK